MRILNYKESPNSLRKGTSQISPSLGLKGFYLEPKLSQSHLMIKIWQCLARSEANPRQIHDSGILRRTKIKDWNQKECLKNKKVNPLSGFAYADRITNLLESLQILFLKSINTNLRVTFKALRGSRGTKKHGEVSKDRETQKLKGSSEIQKDV